MIMCLLTIKTLVCLLWKAQSNTVRHESSLSCNSLLDLSIVFGPQHAYSTRCPPKHANVDRCHLSQTQTYFSYQGAKWWNQLPQNIFLSGILYLVFIIL